MILPESTRDSRLHWIPLETLENKNPAVSFGGWGDGQTGEGVSERQTSSYGMSESWG